MQIITKIFAIVSLLPSISAAECELSGSCDADSETSLMQVTQTVKKGIERSKVPTGNDDDVVLLKEEAEKEAENEGLEEELQNQNTFPASTGCVNMGCYGRKGGNWGCDGNALDCTSRGFSVQGYTTGDAGSGNNCGGSCPSGQLVICEKCSVTPTPPPASTAAPATPAPAWTPPPAPSTQAATTAAPSPTTPAPAGAPPIPAVNESELLVTTAKSDYKTLSEALHNATKLASEIQDNISQAEHDIHNFTKAAEESRASAVRFAEREELVNQTIAKAQRALADATTGKEAAALDAKLEANEANNAALQKVYYKKQLVDQNQAIVDAKDELAVGNVRVHKAYDTLHMSKKAHANEVSYQAGTSAREAANAAATRKQDGRLEVKNAMETAYVESSAGRNDSQVPAWGLHTWTPP